jgi:O-acetyl-ADP-ribose deacetylase (regulator of RNase III)
MTGNRGPLLRAVHGDMTTLDIDAIVNAARTSLLGGRMIQAESSSG